MSCNQPVALPIVIPGAGSVLEQILLAAAPEDADEEEESEAGAKERE